MQFSEPPLQRHKRLDRNDETGESYWSPDKGPVVDQNQAAVFKLSIIFEKMLPIAGPKRARITITTTATKTQYQRVFDQPLAFVVMWEPMHDSSPAARHSRVNPFAINITQVKNVGNQLEN